MARRANKPTHAQVELLAALLADGSYVSDHAVQLPSGRHVAFPHGLTVDACERRGWITYSIIDRRYTITDAGRKAVE